MNTYRTVIGHLSNQIKMYSEIGYPSIVERFVLKNGTMRAGTLYPEEMMTPKECFKNAFELASDNIGVLHYCEGYAIRNGIELPIHHAWCETEDGTVYDPTWTNGDKCEYLGVRIPMEEILEQQKKTGCYGVFAQVMINVDYILSKDPSLKVHLQS